MILSCLSCCIICVLDMLGIPHDAGVRSRSCSYACVRIPATMSAAAKFAFAQCRLSIPTLLNRVHTAGLSPQPVL